MPFNPNSISFWQPTDTEGNGPAWGGWTSKVPGRENLLEANSKEAFSAIHQGLIIEALENLYDHSITAKKIIDLAINTSEGIRIFKADPELPGISKKDIFPSDPNSPQISGPGIIGINIDAINGLYSINKSGVLTQENLALMIVHELSHSMLGTTDPNGGNIPAETAGNNPSFGDTSFLGEIFGPYYFPQVDYGWDGGAVAITNQVAVEMSAFDPSYADHQRVSYFSAIRSYDPLSDTVDIRYPILTQANGASFTEEHAVDIVRYGDNAMSPHVADSYADRAGNPNDDYDMSRVDGHSILLFGFTGADTLRTADGNDYLYGGTGNDILSGGAGDNFLHGGDLGGDTAIDGIDTADYGTSPYAIKLTIGNPASGEILIDDNGWKEPFQIDGNGQPIPNTPFHDRLASIENIIGTKYDDQVTIDDTSLSGYILTDGHLTIDGRRGNNSAIFTSAAHAIENEDGTLGFEDSSLLLKNFPKLLFGDGDDRIDIDFRYSYDTPQNGNYTGTYAYIDLGDGNNIVDLSGMQNIHISTSSPGDGSFLIGNTRISNATIFMAESAGVNYLNLGAYHNQYDAPITVNTGGLASYVFVGFGTWTVNGNGSQDAVNLPGGQSSYAFSGTASSLIATSNYGTYVLNGIEAIVFQDATHASPDEILHHATAGQTISPSYTSPYQIEFTDTDPNQNHYLSVEGGAAFATLTPVLARESWHLDSEGNRISDTGYIQYVVSYNEALDKEPRWAAYDVVMTNDSGDRVVKSVILGNDYVAFSTIEFDTEPNSGTITESYATPIDAAQTISGDIAFTDSYAGDIYSTFSAFDYGTVPYALGSLDLEITTSTGGGNIHWTYTVDESVLRSLPDASTYFEQFSIAIDDGFGNLSTKKIGMTLNTRPDHTTITGSSAPAQSIFQGTTTDGNHIASGYIDFTDLDPRDIHQISISEYGSEVMPGHFEAHVETDTTEGNAGRVVWTYTVSDAEIGTYPQNYHDYYTIRIDDGHGGAEVTSTFMIGVYATRPTEPATLTYPPSIAMRTAQGPTNVGYATGVFSDSDIFVHHTISAEFVSSSIETSSSYGTMVATISSDTYSTTGQHPAGVYNLTYAASEEALSWMNDGDAITETWRVTIDSGYGQIATQLVPVTIARYNMTYVTNSQLFDPDAVLTAHGDDQAPDVIDGWISFSDYNVGEVHNLAASFVASDHGISSLGAMTAAIASDTTDNPYSGFAVWQYAVGDIPSGLAGQDITETWRVDIADGHGGTTSQDIVVRIAVPAAANAPPTVTAIEVSPVDQNDLPILIDLLATATDPENDALSVVEGSLTVSTDDGIPASASITGRMLTLDPSAFAYLAEGQSVTATFSYDVTDGVNVVHNTATATVAGENDAPTAVSWNAGGSISENAANGTLVGILEAADVDRNDTATWTLIDDAGGRFVLSASGEVRVADGGLLDYETATGHDIVVEAEDSGGLTLRRTVHIDVLDVVGQTVTGTSGNDAISGTGEEDVLIGLGGNDTIAAGAGDDLVMPGTGINHSDGDTGVDTLSYAGNPYAVSVNLPTGAVIQYASPTQTGETAVNFENFVGTDYADVLYASSTANVISMGAGNDTVYERILGGADVLDGGDGVDSLVFDQATAAQPIVANLATGATGGAIAGMTLLNFERITGGAGDDVLTGPASANGTVQGGAGDDILRGGSGNDYLNGGTGHDIVYGGPGADQIVDPDDVTVDYSESDAAVSIGYNGSVQTGSGGYAQSDTFSFGNTSTMKIQWILTPYNDSLTIGMGTVKVEAGAGNDTVTSNIAGNYVVHGGDGDDTILLNNSGANTIVGGDGYDVIRPGADGYDAIDFGAGGGVLDLQNATVYAVFVWAEPGGVSTIHAYTPANVDRGTSTVVGDFGTVLGSSLNDVITGNSQDNVIDGKGGIDAIDAGAGNDTVTGSGTIHGGAGDDTVSIGNIPLNSGFGTIFGDDGNDVITLTASTPYGGVVHGGAGDDTIDIAAYGNQYMTIDGGPGADILKAGAGSITYADASSAIAIVGNAGTLGDALGDTIVSGARLFGSNHGDTFTGTSIELHLGTGDNAVTGSSRPVFGNVGDDTVVGTSGSDAIHTGGGHDTVIGGIGNDQIYFDHPGSDDAATAKYAYGDGLDSIFGFLQGSDSIEIALQAGKPDPVVTLSQVGADTDVHIRWYADEPVDGQPLPSHLDADILLKGVALTSFELGHDYHLA